MIDERVAVHASVANDLETLLIRVWL